MGRSEKEIAELNGIIEAYGALFFQIYEGKLWQVGQSERFNEVVSEIARAEFAHLKKYNQLNARSAQDFNQKLHDIIKVIRSISTLKVEIDNLENRRFATQESWSDIQKVRNEAAGLFMHGSLVRNVVAFVLDQAEQDDIKKKVQKIFNFKEYKNQEGSLRDAGDIEDFVRHSHFAQQWEEAVENKGLVTLKNGQEALIILGDFKKNADGETHPEAEFFVTKGQGSDSKAYWEVLCTPHLSSIDFRINRSKMNEEAISAASSSTADGNVKKHPLDVNINSQDHKFGQFKIINLGGILHKDERKRLTASLTDYVGDNMIRVHTVVDGKKESHWAFRVMHDKGLFSSNMGVYQRFYINRDDVNRCVYNETFAPQKENSDKVSREMTGATNHSLLGSQIHHRTKVSKYPHIVDGEIRPTGLKVSIEPSTHNREYKSEYLDSDQIELFNYFEIEIGKAKDVVVQLCAHKLQPVKNRWNRNTSVSKDGCQADIVETVTVTSGEVEYYDYSPADLKEIINYLTDYVNLSRKNKDDNKNNRQIPPCYKLTSNGLIKEVTLMDQDGVLTPMVDDTAFEGHNGLEALIGQYHDNMKNLNVTKADKSSSNLELNGKRLLEDINNLLKSDPELSKTLEEFRDILRYQDFKKAAIAEVTEKKELQSDNKKHPIHTVNTDNDLELISLYKPHNRTILSTREAKQGHFQDALRAEVREQEKDNPSQSTSNANATQVGQTKSRGCTIS